MCAGKFGAAEKQCAKLPAIHLLKKPDGTPMFDLITLQALLAESQRFTMPKRPAMPGLPAMPKGAKMPTTGDLPLPKGVEMPKGVPKGVPKMPKGLPKSVPKNAPSLPDAMPDALPAAVDVDNLPKAPKAALRRAAPRRLPSLDKTLPALPAAPDALGSASGIELADRDLGSLDGLDDGLDDLVEQVIQRLCAPTRGRVAPKPAVPPLRIWISTNRPTCLCPLRTTYLPRACPSCRRASRGAPRPKGSRRRSTAARPK